MKDRKILLFALLLGVTSTLAQAQVKVNPQVGGFFTSLSNTPADVSTSAAIGFQLGVDLRIGKRLYFQPGAYFGRSATVVHINSLDTNLVDNMIRTTAKVKALLGFNVINGGTFKLRVNAGPTYEALLSVDSKDDKIAFNKSDYNGGSFNMDGGIGVDIAVVTLEAGVSYGLSNAYKDQGKLLGDSKYFTWYATLGLVFGGGK